MNGSPKRPEIERVAREALGIERLRTGQVEALEAVLDGRDTIAVMSTGYGKSAIYQIAGCLIDGPTVVVSPLIALQRDQVESIEEEMPGEAAQLNSAVGERERREILGDLAAGEREFVLLAPEQLAKPEVLERLREARPSLLVVDEAHCISEWGHDFRPDYLRLGAFAAELGSPVTLALTATAAPPVRSEIAEQLRMRDPAVVVRGFDRPNIHLAVQRHIHASEKESAVLETVARADKPGIVYVATRRGAEELAAALAERGVSAAAYHAGLGSGLRDELQERFMDDEIEVIVATTAFGMGIDKPNVRFVHHAEISDSLDSYYQEVGRAGRDGEPAAAVLFYRTEDQGLRRFFASGQVEGEEVERVGRELERRRGPVHPAELAEGLDLSETKLASAVSRLEETGAAELLPSGELRAAMHGAALEEALETAAEAAEGRQAFDQSRVEMMRRYAEHNGCRRDFVLSYFGEEHEAPCGNCDNCDAGLVAPEEEDDRPFAVGSLVEHADWGPGEVQRYDDDQVVVLFDSVGYKTLGVELVLDRELLREA
jgi:ATP-dependent DNA helicase RecQ